MRRKTSVSPLLLDLILLLRRRNAEGLAKLVAWCLRYVERWHRLTAEDHEDIVQAAILETLDTESRQPDCSDAELAGALLRALAKFKKRRQRELRRLLDDGITAYELSSRAIQERNLISSDLYRRVREVLFEAVAAEIPRLADRAHDLVVREYRLEAFFPARQPAPVFSTAGAARKASWRARRALGDRLARSFREKIEQDPSDEDGAILRICLEIVLEKDSKTLSKLFDDE